MKSLESIFEARAHTISTQDKWVANETVVTFKVSIDQKQTHATLP